MKKLFGLVTVLVFSFVLSAQAETIKAVSLAVKESNGSTDGAQFKAYLAANGDVDFGSFDFCKATTYFIASDFKIGTTQYKIKAVGASYNYKFFVYNADKYELANDPAECVSGDNIAAVFKNALSGEMFALVSVRGTYKDDKVAATLGPVKTYIENNVKGPYPDAHVIVTYNARLTGTYATTGKTYPDILDAYLVEDNTGPQMIRLGRNSVGGNSVGGFYTYPDSSMTAYSVGDVDISSTYHGTFLTATYPTKHRVIFEDWDGTGLQTNVVLEGGSVEPPTPPARTGFVFIGWDHTAEEFESVMADFTATAQYEQSATGRLVTFLDWDGTILDKVGVEAGEKVARPEDLHRDGYAFDGWMCGDTPYDFNAPVTTDLTLTAKYHLILLHEIGTAEELVERVSWALPAEVVYSLTNDLDFAGITFTPTNFYGVLEGNGYEVAGLDDKRLFKDLYGTVRNLNIRGDGELHDVSITIGVLAAHSYGARIENCQVVDLYRKCRTTNGAFGCLVAYSDDNDDSECTIVSNCTARGCRLIGDPSYKGEKLGGLIGSAAHTRVYGCRFLADPAEVSVGSGEVVSGGAIIGYATGDVEVYGCLSEGYVNVPFSEGNNTGAGGIVGGTSGSCAVYDCTNRATIIGCHQNGNGGIMGRASKTSVRIGRCVNFGSVSSEIYGTGTNPCGIGAGGIFGGNWYNTSSTVVFDCANYGPVTTGTNTVSAGGIVAMIDGNNGNTSSTISNCMNYASVSSPYAAGGVLGYMSKLSKPLYNVGNCGSVSSDDSAGGIVGKLTFYLNNNKCGVNGLMQAGTVTTSTGFVGVVIGRLVGASNSGCTFPIRCGVLAGSATATNGGQAGLIVGGTSPFGTTGEISYSVDELTAAVDTEMAHYYNKDNEPQRFDSLASMQVGDLKNHVAAEKLNTYASANGFMSWVQTENYPELSMFAQGVIPEPAKGGMVIFFR